MAKNITYLGCILSNLGCKNFSVVLVDFELMS